MLKNVVDNPIADKVFECVEYTNQSIFLTGKAGTGKTTLLQRIKLESKKKIIIVAPTGVAAMNAKGTTINSFFQLPPGSFFPGDISFQHLQTGISSIQSTINDINYPKDKTTLLNELELLVIDEVSMVRCDVLDVLDALLRKVRKQNSPFGGLQLLLIGDLYQLPPVTKQEDWSVLSKAYPSPYFFDSLVIRKYPLLQIELDKVFRQTEETFIKILNDIRNNQINDLTLQQLNERFNPDYNYEEGITPIIITSHNAEANAINKQKLDQLDSPLFTFDATVEGEFKELGMQAEQILQLKVGAQVMFIKNDSGDDRRFYNGKIGKIKSIEANNIYISFVGEDDLLLEKSTWPSFEYRLNEEDNISQQQIGEFSQYPIKLAWAVTIHKSQGLTFDNAIIDAGKSFIAGQVYVALSRVRTLDGLILKSKINKDSLRSNAEVQAYLKPLNITELTAQITKFQEQFILKIILDHFSIATILNSIEDLQADTEINKANLPEFKALLSELKESAKALLVLAEKFAHQVKKLHEQENGFIAQESIQARIESASIYFNKELNQKLLSPIVKMIRVKPKNKIQQQIQHQLQKVRLQVENRITLIKIGVLLFKDPISTDQYIHWINKNRKQQKINQQTETQTTQAITLQLF